MAHPENTTGADIVPAGDSAVARPASESQAGQMMAHAIKNMREVFGFETHKIVLDENGAYHVKGKTKAYGLEGAVRIANDAGIYIHHPETLMMNGTEYTNPHLIYNEDGIPKLIHTRKVPVYLKPTGGISYTDFIDTRSLTASIAEKAINLVINNDVQRDSYRYCPRDAALEWNKAFKNPGDDLWQWYALPGNMLGIAFNTTVPNQELAKFIKKNIEDEMYLTQKCNTKAMRRAVSAVYPECLVALPIPKPVISNNKVVSATFEYVRPTKNEFFLSMLRKVAMGLMSGDAGDLQDAVANIANTLQMDTGQINVEHVSGAEEIEEPIEIKEAQAVEVNEGTGEVRPHEPTLPEVPQSGVGNIKNWLVENGTLFNEEQVGWINKLTNNEPGNPVQSSINKDNIDKVIKLLNLIRDGKEPNFKSPQKENAPANQAPTLDQMKAYLLEKVTPGRLDFLLTEAGQKEGVSLELVPEEAIVNMYTMQLGGTKPGGPE